MLLLWFRLDPWVSVSFLWFLTIIYISTFTKDIQIIYLTHITMFVKAFRYILMPVFDLLATEAAHIAFVNSATDITNYVPIFQNYTCTTKVKIRFKLLKIKMLWVFIGINIPRNVFYKTTAVKKYVHCIVAKTAVRLLSQRLNKEALKISLI